jgi:hypothetical protein
VVGPVVTLTPPGDQGIETDTVMRKASCARAAIADRRQNRYADNPRQKERQTETKKSAAIASVSLR